VVERGPQIFFWFPCQIPSFFMLGSPAFHKNFRAFPSVPPPFLLFLLGLQVAFPPLPFFWGGPPLGCCFALYSFFPKKSIKAAPFSFFLLLRFFKHGDLFGTFFLHPWETPPRFTPCQVFFSQFFFSPNCRGFPGGSKGISQKKHCFFLFPCFPWVPHRTFCSHLCPGSCFKVPGWVPASPPPRWGPLFAPTRFFFSVFPLSGLVYANPLISQLFLEWETRMFAFTSSFLRPSL